MGERKKEGLNVFIATPAYDGTVSIHLASSLITAMRLLDQAGVRVTWQTLSGCCYLPVVRNKLLKDFLAGEFTDLLFIDSDVGFGPEAVAKILTHDVDVVAGAVPYRTDDAEFPAVLFAEDNKPIVQNGLLKAQMAATAFMRVRRGVFTKIIEEFGDLMIVSEKDASGRETDRYLAAFDTQHVGTEWWGEDKRFCEMVRSLGIDVWIDPDLEFVHTGSKSWRGNFGEMLRGKGKL